MADTPPDMILLNDEYQDVIAATGLPTTENLLVLNKSNSVIILQLQPTQPPVANRVNGRTVQPNEEVVVQKDFSGLWALGKGRILVQEIE